MKEKDQKTVERLVQLNRELVDHMKMRQSVEKQLSSVARRVIGGYIDPETSTYKFADSVKETAKREVEKAKKGESTLLGAVCDTHVACYKMAMAAEKDIEKEMLKVAKELSFHDWWNSQRGLATKSLARIIGEAGDVSRFQKPSALWKWFGLHVNEKGSAPKPTAGQFLGYSLERRSVAWQLMISIRMQTADSNCFWWHLMDMRKRYERARAEESGLKVVEGAQYKKLPKEAKAGCITKGHIRDKAERYVQKQIIKMLWERVNDSWDDKIPAFLDHQCFTQDDLRTLGYAAQKAA